eukprot:TRINITY_DN43317_c0_g1_i1.p1 TRINITY_DN43317_c0_g1~~TRINITY_DN43317_c0_g1_i1.p1  ORF type:complete len:235 (+),score=32.72 TRINITY_DN43317_c0_g1_i1:46-705(+)
MPFSMGALAAVLLLAMSCTACVMPRCINGCRRVFPTSTEYANGSVRCNAPGQQVSALPYPCFAQVVATDISGSCANATEHSDGSVSATCTSAGECAFSMAVNVSTPECACDTYPGCPDGPCAKYNGGEASASCYADSTCAEVPECGPNVYCTGFPSGGNGCGWGGCPPSSDTPVPIWGWVLIGIGALAVVGGVVAVHVKAAKSRQASVENVPEEPLKAV